jgi:BT1 family
MTNPGIADDLAPRPAALRNRLVGPIMAPIRAFRLAYLPLVMIYLASGALGLVAVADSFWVKSSLTLSPADLASLAVWLQLPWTAKMVFSEFVDAVPILGSRRRVYTVIGGMLTAGGLLLLAAAAAGWITSAQPEHLYVLAQFLVVIGSVIQEVVADAMSAEVVAHARPDGTPRPQTDIDADLAMVQVLARLAYSIGALSVAGLAGILAQSLSYAAVFLIGVAVPLLSMVGALLIRLETGVGRGIDWRVLGGGVALAATAALLGLTGFRFAQEAAFVLALAVICLMLRRLFADLQPQTRRLIVVAAIMIFAFRAVPTLGDGYRWFTMDRLGFDERFFGVLQLTGTAIGLAAMWLLSDSVVRRPVRRVLLWLTLIAALLWLPSLLLVHGVHEWTQPALGIGPRTIAMVDEAAQSPLALLATVPLLTLIARHAPAHHRATWFALVASLMSLAIVASQLLTKYLNLVFPIERGDYTQLGWLVASVVAISLVLPLTAIVLLGRRLEGKTSSD